MSNELSTDEITQALAAIDSAYNAADVAQDQAVKLAGHIAWLTEQLAERDEQIDRLIEENEALKESIEALESGD